MPHRSVFIFDSSYPSIDVALPIDDKKPHIVVVDREIEAPPGHKYLQLNELADLGSFRRDLRLLRAAWIREGGGECIVIAAPGTRREKLLLNTLLARLLCRNVLLFDGECHRSVIRSWRLLTWSTIRVLGKCAFGPLNAWIKSGLLRLGMKYHSVSSTADGALFGYYGLSQSFSLPLDKVFKEPDGASIYGEYSRGWYLPHLSHRRQRYVVRTTRHRLRDIFLHVQDVYGSAERFLFMDGHMLDYPYLLMRTRQNSRYLVSTRNESKSIKRGIDLLCYTSGYYHWLLEGVPRILDLIDDGIDFDHYPLVLPPLEPYQRELLKVFGISPDSQVVTVGKNDWCHVEDCIFPTAYFPFAAPELDDPSGQPDGSLLRRIRDRVMERLPRLPVDSTYSPKRIYISRAKARWRRLTDQSEGDVRSVLEARGFETVFLEDMAWTEQVLLLSGAEFIAGLHGAGLANILFAKAGTLLELHNPLEARSYFALMARELNMRYAYIIGTLGGCSKKFNNIVVDCQDLERIVNQLDGAS